MGRQRELRSRGRGQEEHEGEGAHLGLARLGRRDEVLLEDAEDVLADCRREIGVGKLTERARGKADEGRTVGELLLDLLAVGLDRRDLGAVALGLCDEKEKERRRRRVSTPHDTLISRALAQLGRKDKGRTSSLPSMDETILHDARRAPMTFLYATERRLRSSIESSELSDAMLFIWLTICERMR